MTDEKLIQSVLSGNRNDFGELIRRYEPRVAATVIGMLGDCPEADDVGQETFIRFYNNLDNFRGDSSVITYLTRIAINLSLNEIKKRKRKNRFTVNQDENWNEYPDGNASQPYNENREIVRWAIRQLEPKFRTVLVLRLIDGYSTAETAEVLNLPAGTVLSRLSRAQQKLKNLLSPVMGA